MVWQKTIRPTRENSNLPLYDNRPEVVAAEPEPVSRREQRRLRRRTACNFSEVAQVATAGDHDDESQVREQTNNNPCAADGGDKDQEHGQGDANVTAKTGESTNDSLSDALASNPSDDGDCSDETASDDHSPTPLVLHAQENENQNQDVQILNGLNSSAYKTSPKGQGEFPVDEEEEVPIMTFWGTAKTWLYRF
ncbi:hypothetical protein ACHAPT_002801 [Fusarium lateritium]